MIAGYTKLSQWLGRARGRIRVDKRYSAALTYSAARRAGLDRRMAYLCAVARCGWEHQAKLAYGTCLGWSLAERFLHPPGFVRVT